MMIDKLVGYSFIVAIILLTTGCGSSATAKSDNTATDTVVVTDEYDETQYDTTEELYTEAEEQVADEYESETTSSTNIDDFIDGSTFYVDKYAESLGYTTLLNNNDYNSLLIDVGGTHYYISVSKTNYNLFYCKGDCTYGINTTDIDGEEKTMEVSSGEKTKGCTSTWVHEIARLLEYIATTSPDEVDIESLDLEIRNSGTIYHGTGSFDENGAIDTDSLVGTNPELIWNENIDK